MRTSSLVALLAAPLAGCGLLHPSDAVLAQRVEDHLAERYGRPFDVEIRSRPLISLTPGGRAPNHRSFRAIPAGEPHRAVKGWVDLGASPPEIRDDYACVRVGEWLAQAIEAGMGVPARLRAVSLQCTSYEGPGAVPPEGQPLPAAFATLYAEVAVFAEGHPVDVATQACEAYRAAAGRFGVRARGSCGAFPAGLADAPAALDRLRGDAPIEDLDGMQLAEIQAEPENAPPRHFPRRPEVEDAHFDAVRAALPAAEVAVRARPRDPRYPDATLRVDVRVAADGLDLPAMEALAERLRPLPGRLGREIRGVDRAGPGAPQRRAFVCRARGCEEVAPPLIDPMQLLGGV